MSSVGQSPHEVSICPLLEKIPMLSGEKKKTYGDLSSAGVAPSSDNCVNRQKMDLIDDRIGCDGPRAPARHTEP